MSISSLLLRISTSLKIRKRHLIAVFLPRTYVLESIWLSSSEEDLAKNVSPRGEELNKLFIKYGSDKSLAHDYHLPYAELLDTCPEGPLCEIGIGSKNPIFPAAMVNYGTPGGSLRAWKNINIFTHIYGADIDEEVLFFEVGITTSVVDQLDASSLNKFANYLLEKEPLGFSLIIDDGFHNFAANINSLRALRHLVKSGGY